MEYRFTAIKKKGYVHIQVQGDNNPQNVLRWVREGLEVCARHKCPNVLIEENMAGGSLSLLDTFSIVEEASIAARWVVTHIAYIDANPAHDPSILTFTETVARNRGMNLRLFADVEEAERWMAGISRA